MTHEDRTATDRLLGALLGLRETCAICKCSETTMRGLLKAGLGPPMFKCPASNRWLGFENEARLVGVPAPLASSLKRESLAMTSLSFDAPHAEPRTSWIHRLPQRPPPEGWTALTRRLRRRPAILVNLARDGCKYGVGEINQGGIA
jgi:hypothetical protein